MAEASSPNFSAPFNALIAGNQAPPVNPLTQASNIVGLQTGMANAQRATLEADDEALANARNHFNSRVDALTPYIAKGDKVTSSDVLHGLSDLVETSKGAFSANEAAHFYAGLPQAPNGDFNAPNPALAAALKQHQMRLMSAVDQIATQRGLPAAIGRGDGTQLGTRDSYSGAFTPQAGPNGFIRSRMSPAEAASPAPASVDPTTGATRTQTLGERAEGAGLAPGGTYTGQGGAQRVYIGANGRITRPPQGAGSMPLQSRAGGPIQTAPSPAQTEVLKSSGDQFAAAGQNAATYGQQMTQLQSALTGLQNTSTGPGTESRQSIASYMLALPGGIGAYLPGVDPKSIQAYDEANKYLTQAAQGSPNATRSDAGLNTALASSPSVHISNAAAQDIQKANMGFRRAEMANYAAFQRSGLDAGQFQSFVAQRNQQIDPRAFSVDLLSPAQRGAFMQSLSPAAKTKFLSSVRDAMASGMIDASALSGGARAR